MESGGAFVRMGWADERHRITRVPSSTLFVRHCPLHHLRCRPDCDVALRSLASFETSSASVSELDLADRVRLWLSKDKTQEAQKIGTAMAVACF